MKTTHWGMGVVVATLFAASSAQAQFSINWWTVDGGGGTSSGGGFTLTGTIGQHDASNAIAGGSFAVFGGFWGGSPAPGCPADLDNGSGTGVPDDAVDINDLLYFLTFFELGSVEVDLDNDGDPAAGVPDGAVDVNDLLYFIARFEGGC